MPAADIACAAFISRLGRTGAFNLSVCAWIPCGIMLTSLACTMGRDEDDMQVGVVLLVLRCGINTYLSNTYMRCTTPNPNLLQNKKLNPCLLSSMPPIPSAYVPLAHLLCCLCHLHRITWQNSRRGPSSRFTLNSRQEVPPTTQVQRGPGHLLPHPSLDLKCQHTAAAQPLAAALPGSFGAR